MTTKSEIAALELQLKEHLKDKEWKELNDTLNRKYKAIVSAQVRKNLPQ